MLGYPDIVTNDTALDDKYKLVGGWMNLLQVTNPTTSPQWGTSISDVIGPSCHYDVIVFAFVAPLES